MYAWVSLFNKIVDRHLRYDLIQLLPSYDSKQSAMKLLKGAYTFNYFNPTGHYRLKLSNQVERDVAVTLLMFNRKYKQFVEQGNPDTSQMGNLSWFRNEKTNGVPFVYNEEYVLPEQGYFEWDFVYLWTPPSKEGETPEDKLDMIKDLILSLEGNLEHQITSFKAISEYLVLSSRQLGNFVDLVDEPKWKTECFIYGVGRIHDTKNVDFIKKKWKFPETSKEIYNRFGIFNLFNKERWTGSYRLDLSIYEERGVCTSLLAQAKVQGYQSMTKVILNGKPIEEINKEFVDSLPKEGIFEGSFIPPEISGSN